MEIDQDKTIKEFSYKICRCAIESSMTYLKYAFISGMAMATCIFLIGYIFGKLVYEY